MQLAAAVVSPRCRFCDVDWRYPQRVCKQSSGVPSL